ncbi:hypothetical protein Bpfe_009038 [Biomphalaria pfeifferi]|uniref:Uncharacterized protein n=1 Tax=Biomphalaria pfeifferi TaxID=112525 RepID=A0AAD8FFM1_BIOPF|nr:hypothetical protein Bpfe_009038 [Biomphalaria pfeifferi]
MSTIHLWCFCSFPDAPIASEHNTKVMEPIVTSSLVRETRAALQEILTSLDLEGIGDVDKHKQESPKRAEKEPSKQEMMTLTKLATPSFVSEALSAAGNTIRSQLRQIPDAKYQFPKRRGLYEPPKAYPMWLYTGAQKDATKLKTKSDVSTRRPSFDEAAKAADEARQNKGKGSDRDSCWAAKPKQENNPQTVDSFRELRFCSPPINIQNLHIHQGCLCNFHKAKKKLEKKTKSTQTCSICRTQGASFKRRSSSTPTAPSDKVRSRPPSKRWNLTIGSSKHPKQNVSQKSISRNFFSKIYKPTTRIFTSEFNNNNSDMDIAPATKDNNSSKTNTSSIDTRSKHLSRSTKKSKRASSHKSKRRRKSESHQEQTTLSPCPSKSPSRSSERKHFKVKSLPPDSNPRRSKSAPKSNLPKRKEGKQKITESKIEMAENSFPTEAPNEDRKTPKGKSFSECGVSRIANKLITDSRNEIFSYGVTSSSSEDIKQKILVGCRQFDNEAKERTVMEEFIERKLCDQQLNEDASISMDADSLAGCDAIESCMLTPIMEESQTAHDKSSNDFNSFVSECKEKMNDIMSKSKSSANDTLSSSTSRFVSSGAPKIQENASHLKENIDMEIFYEVKPSSNENGIERKSIDKSIQCKKIYSRQHTPRDWLGERIHGDLNFSKSKYGDHPDSCRNFTCNVSATYPSAINTASA